jgi:hypothetical protein
MVKGSPGGLKLGGTSTVQSDVDNDDTQVNSSSAPMDLPTVGELPTISADEGGQPQVLGLRRTRRAWSRLAALFNRALVRPNPGSGDSDEEGLAYERAKDAAANAAAFLPSTEHVGLHSVWVAEAFPPTAVQGLVTGIAALGWDNARDDLPWQPTLTAWLERSRRSPLGGHWWQLSRMVREDAKSARGMQRFRLPEGVRYALPTVHQRTPSTTIVVVQFVLDSGARAKIEEPLTKEHSTFLRTVGRGHQYVNPFMQKREETSAIRRDARRRCEAWMSRYLPGLFSRHHAHPTAELFALDEAIPYANSDGVYNANYLDVLGLSFDPDASEDEFGMRLGSLYGSGYKDEDERNLVFAVNPKFLAAALDKKYPGLHGSEMYMHDVMDRAMALWAIRHQLSLYESELAILRDKIAVVAHETGSTAASRLAEAQTRLISLVGDAMTLGSELSTSSARFTAGRKDLPEFKTLDQRPRQPVSVLEGLNDWCSESAKRLRDFVAEIRDVTVTTSSLLSTAAQERATVANLRLQRWFFVFAIVAILIAALQLALSLKK